MLAYKLATFLPALVLPEAVKRWSLTTLHKRLVKIGTGIVRDGRSVIFQVVEVAVPRGLFTQTLWAISTLRPSPPARC